MEERGDVAWSEAQGLETGCPVQGCGRQSWLPDILPPSATTGAQLPATPSVYSWPASQPPMVMSNLPSLLALCLRFQTQFPGSNVCGLTSMRWR